MTDPLTKLPNRMAYEEKGPLEHSRLSTAGKKTFLGIIDVDHFKQINDKYGHSIGDKTLQVIASHIRKNLAANDFLARWGGEEFVVILEDEQKNDCAKKLDKLRQQIEKLPFMFKGQRVSVTVSAGVARFDPQHSLNEIFEEADTLLYEAKNDGRNQIKFKESE
jgi:diguanylate cyclase (GGDEF)-like protein